MSSEKKILGKRPALLDPNLSVAELQALLKNGADIKENDHGCNALHASTLVASMFREKLPILLQAGVDVNAQDLRDKFSNTPLHILIAHEDQVNALFLINDAGTKIDFSIEDAQRKTTLIISTKINSTLISLAILKKIGNNPAVLNKQDEKGMSALHYACLYGNIAIANALINAGASTTLLNSERKTPIDCVVLGRAKIEETLQSIEIDPMRDEKARANCFGNKYGDPLISAATSLPSFLPITVENKPALLELLKNPLIDTTLQYQKKIALMGRQEKEFIKSQAELLTGKKLSTALAESASLLKKHLLENGHYSDFLLRSEAASGNAESIERLLAHPHVRIDAQGLPSGRTALHQAALNNHSDICMLLIKSGANLSLQDSAGNTALHLALQRNYFDLAQALVLQGADITIINKQGETALCLLDKKGQHVLKTQFFESARSFSHALISCNDGEKPVSCSSPRP